MAIDLLSYQNLMDQDGVIFYYKGEFTQEFLLQIGRDLRSKIRGETENRTLSIKVFSVFVELIQNVTRYAVPYARENEADASVGIVVVGRDNNHYFVCCGNEIDAARKAIVVEKLETIKNMDKDEIKTYFREQRKKAPEANSKGGGIGLIEIAKLASEPIGYTITSMEGDRSFYSLTVTV